MTAPHDPTPGEPQPAFQQFPQSGSTPLSGHDATTGLQYPVGYPSAPITYPPTTGQFDPIGQPAPYGGAPYPAAPYGGATYGGAPYDPAAYSPPPYGQPPYATPGYGLPYQGVPAPRNGMGTAALVLGIIGVVLCWNPVGIILGILAVIFGGVGLGRAKRGEATNRGAAMAGLVLGIVAVVLLILLVVVGVGLFAAGVSTGV